MRILAITCMRNEAPYCLEWVAHHRAAGFTDFLIYTHDCSDGTDALLDKIPYVTHVPFPQAEGKSPQWSAMKLADKHPLLAVADWAMFFDCDEFLCLDAPLTNVTDLTASVPEKTDAIALQWRLFGSSKQIDWVQGLTIERFTMAAPSDLALPAGHFFKTLFRPSKFQKLGVHRPKNKKHANTHWMLGGTETAPTAFAENDSRINLFGAVTTQPSAWLNHYSTKSVTEFMIKRDRGLPNRQSKNIDLSYWAERNFNTVENLTIEQMLPSTLAEIEDLCHIDGIPQHLEAAETHHRETFETAMRERNEVMMFMHLSLLDGSIPPSRHIISSHLKRLSLLQKS